MSFQPSHTGPATPTVNRLRSVLYAHLQNTSLLLTDNRVITNFRPMPISPYFIHHPILTRVHHPTHTASANLHAVNASHRHGMPHVVAIRPKPSSSEKQTFEAGDGRRVYEGRRGCCGRRVQRTITMAILSLLATAAVLVLSGRVSVGVPGLFTPTSYE